MSLRRRIAMAALVAASSAGMVAVLVARRGRGWRTAEAGPTSEDAALPVGFDEVAGASASTSLVVRLNRRANALAAEGRVREALSLLGRAEGIDPGAAPTCYNRGRILHRLRRYGEALAAYDRALELRPDYAKPLTNRAMILARSGDVERALADLARAIEIAPGRTAAYYQRARIRLKHGDRKADLEAARADLDRLIALDPGDAGAYLLRAEAAEALGDRKGAELDRARAREIETGRPPEWVPRGPGAGRSGT